MPDGCTNLQGRTAGTASWQRPTLERLWRAIEVYLAEAYDGAPPAHVRQRLDDLRATSEGDLFDRPVLEREPTQDPSRISLRLGNRHYPHMKLVIERAPDGEGHLFRADTHDQHCMPSPDDADYAPYLALVAKNQAIASAVEAAWARERLPTFAAYLRTQCERKYGGRRCAENAAR